MEDPDIPDQVDVEDPVFVEDLREVEEDVKSLETGVDGSKYRLSRQQVPKA